MLEAGVLLEGEYEVWGRVGGGGMGDVWLARHVDMAMPLIIKTLRGEGSGGSVRERLLREARLMARVRSPHVVRAIDVGVYRDTPYLVQEYVDGLDLDELTERRARALGLGVPLWFVCQALADAARGLHAAHQTGILHRDVKPSNLFFSPEEGLKLGDFGIAHNRNHDERSGSICGTLSFMAPEALRGGSVDRRSDIFALGATGFCLRYGRPPFETASAVLALEPPRFPPPTTAEEAFFQHVLARAMAPQREARYADLNEPRRLLRSLARSLHQPLRALAQPDGSVQVGPTRITFEVGDISFARCDAIVCPANPQLSMQVGVAGALLQRGGAAIEQQAQAGGDQPLGSCLVTDAGRLDCRKVIHAVSAWREASCIARAAQRTLLCAEELGLQRLAMPALGTGIAGVSIEAAANSIASALRVHLELGGSRLREVRFVLYDDDKLQAFREVFLCLLLGSGDEHPLDSGLPTASHRVSDAAISIDGATHIALPR